MSKTNYECRFYAIVRPLAASKAAKNMKYFLAAAWITAAVSASPQVCDTQCQCFGIHRVHMNDICIMRRGILHNYYPVHSLSPQLYIFHVATHPKFTWYTQCVDMWFISGPDERAWQEAYLILHAALLFFIPLAVIIVTYTIILVTINNNRRLCSGKQSRSHSEKISNSSSRLLLSSPPFHVPHPLDAYPYHVRLHANDADLKLNQITIFSCWISWILCSRYPSVASGKTKFA